MKFKRNWFAGVLVAVWLLSTVIAFWWFQFRNVQVFDADALTHQAVFFQSGELGQRLENLVEASYRTENKAAISVIHFWDPDCPCSRFNEVHVKKIISSYIAKNVQFTIVVKGGTAEARHEHMRLAQQVFQDSAVKEIRSDWPVQNGPPSSPAVAVINRQGQLVYFGPYSLGARCAPDKGKFVETVLDKLDSEKNSASKKQLNTLAVGCFCPWRTES